MKRKASTQISNPLSKTIKTNNIANSFLAPLQNKIDPLQNYDVIVNDFEDKPVYQQPTNINFYKEISDFISKQLASNRSSQIDNRTFKKVNIRPGRGSGLYEPSTQQLNIYDGDSPFKTFIHEGTHALDDLHMRTYQKEALDFLAKHGRDNSVAPPRSIGPSQDPGYWYENARKIISSPTFKQRSYNFGTGGYKTVQKESYPKDVKQSMIDGAEEILDPKNPSKTYEQVSHNYQNLTNKDSEFFNPLSEFIAFGVENLNLPWSKTLKNIDYSNKDFLTKDHGSNLGRKFLKKMTKATYTGFRDIYNQQPNPNQTFMQAYPAMHQSFLDRLVELRNANKHSDANTFKQAMYNKLYPSLNTPMTTTSTTVPTTSNINTTTTTPTVNPFLNATTTELTTTTPTNNPTPQFQTTVTRANNSPGKLIFQRTPGTERSVRFQPY
jgi:hypothetical protein